MNSPNEPALTPESPESTATTRTSPRIGRAPGTKNSAPQARAVRTREAIIAVAARHFDTDGYGQTSMNTIAHTGKFAKGAMYYHFPSKEAIAEHLISDWKRTVNESISKALATGSSTTVGEKLTAIFTSLAHQIAENTNLRAGMKLTLEPSIDNGAASRTGSTPSATSSKTPSPTENSPTPPPHTDSHGTYAPAPSEQSPHQQRCEKTSTSQPASQTW
ncbi:TetR/AcrR family transcriptional regulator [Rhodococcus erythropolis]|uniref:TetR/AcrR family transcriptional regulator n=1 Tax=Rhodococcus erythropolis TaxID=1833 RepID=UPI00038E6500|nr:TetR/AcrR family transcriptional regulator [Rhodococcus erythropolis]EQM30141.1 hypothetical protein N601_29360 [Rhodococcus erythropolis DN1]